MASIALPSNVRVIVRGWLNCNQIVLLSVAENVIIDSGYGRDAKSTLSLLREAHVLGDNPLHRLINTHCHSDHMGGNALLAESYGCRITIPAGEAKHVVPWTEQSCWGEMMDQFTERFAFDDTLDPGDSFEGAGLSWNAIEAPGHDMDAMMFWCKQEGILITGDALWENGMGFVWPDAKTGPDSPLAAALATLESIEALKVRVVIPGHGAPFSGVHDALARARGRLHAFARSPEKNARHIVKVMFVFALLDKKGMALRDVPAYLAGVPVYRDMNERFLFSDFHALAERTVAELVAANAIKIHDGWVAPCMAA